MFRRLGGVRFYKIVQVRTYKTLQIEITPTGIKTALSRYDYKRAIAEFIWNGFDAEATCVNLIYEANEIGAISELGSGRMSNGQTQPVWMSA
jgi:hypothetical protein